MGNGLQLGGAGPGGVSGDYQYNDGSGGFGGGPLRRVSSTIIDVGATPITGAVGVAAGTTAQRPGSPITGYFRYNSTTGLPEMWNGAAWLSLDTGTGDVVGPASSTDNAITRWDGTTGLLVQDSVVLVGDTGAMTGVISIANGSGAVGTPSYNFTAFTTSGLYAAAGPIVSMAVGGVQKMAWSATEVTSLVPIQIGFGYVLSTGLDIAVGGNSTMNDTGSSMGFTTSGGTHYALMPSGGLLAWNNAAAVSGTPDLTLGRLAAASLRQGASPSATPTAQTFTLGEASRSGTDTDVSGSSGTIRSGLGTGSAAATSLLFQTPTVGATSSAAQAYGTRFTVATASLTTTVPLLFSADNTIDVGAAGATRPRSAYLGTSLFVGTNPSTTGSIGIANATSISWRNAANNADIAVLQLTAGDVIQLGNTTAITLSPTDGGLRINNQTISSAGVGVGTFTNTPNAAGGNPAGYLPINIAGTLRYLPFFAA